MRCAGCCETVLPGDLAHGKCIDCWRVEAVYLRTNIAAIAHLLSLDRRRTPRERETEKVLRGALEPIDRAGYLRGRNMEVDADGCGVSPGEAHQGGAT